MLVIKQITDEIEAVDNVKLLDVDPGKDTNRTVVTFVGDPDAVVEAAFRAVSKAAGLIDMSKHHGAHPRMGATDVCPLVPVSGISMEETVEYARSLAERIGNELNIPVYCYEYAAFDERRKNLAYCRSGEYEGLRQKLTDPVWKPDFGPAEFNSRSGATAVGARDFLVAYNINLNTTSTRRANALAFDVREKGRTLKNEKGEEINIPGTLKCVKAIGWFIPEYGMAQISMNLTNISVTPLHVAFDEVCRKADNRGLRVTGSEIVGLVPLKAMLDAGKYFLMKQQRSAGVPDSELIKIAVRSMGLNDIHQFNPEDKIIEYVMAEKDKRKLINMDLREFMEVTASESVAPGGGSVSSYIGALGVALGTMVANLSAHKKGWDERWNEFSLWAEKGKELQNKLLLLVDEDTDAYNKIIEAYRLPKSNDNERNTRDLAAQDAIKNAMLIPLNVMETAVAGFELIENMVEEGNPSSVSDAGVGAMALLASIKGAFLNVRINSGQLADKETALDLVNKGKVILAKAVSDEKRILDKVDSSIL